MQRSRARHREWEPEVERPQDVEHEHPVLALQGAVGNSAVARMLDGQRAVARKEAPMTRLGEKPVTQLYGRTDEKTWAEKVKAKDYIPLYAELAQMIQADRVQDVTGTAEANVNSVRRWNEDLKPGLNFAGNLPGRGRTGFLVDGKFAMKLPAERADGPLPAVVVLLGPHAFDPDNKALALGVLRHELEHAVHSRAAIGWLKQWREKDGGKTRFLRWLGRQQISPVELALVDENLSGDTTRTEALANAEGFMAAFTVERAEVADADGPAREELSDVAQHYAKAKEATQREVVARLKTWAAALAPALRPKYQKTLQLLHAKGGVYAAFAKDLGFKK